MRARLFFPVILHPISGCPPDIHRDCLTHTQHKPRELETFCFSLIFFFHFKCALDSPGQHFRATITPSSMRVMQSNFENSGNGVNRVMHRRRIIRPGIGGGLWVSVWHIVCTLSATHTGRCGSLAAMRRPFFLLLVPVLFNTEYFEVYSSVRQPISSSNGRALPFIRELQAPHEL